MTPVGEKSSKIKYREMEEIINLSAWDPMEVQGDKALTVSIIISVAGMILVLGFLARTGSGLPTANSSLVWALFSALSVLGASATLFPSRCSRSKDLPSELDEGRYTMIDGVRLVHGHHPSCGHFSGHEFTLGRKSYCAGCFGLLLGSLISLAVASSHFIFGIRFPLFSGYMGVASIIFGLFYVPVFTPREPWLRVLCNLLLVTGFALTLTGVDNVGYLGFDLTVVGLCVFWILTRIQLSRWSHDAVCAVCGEPCELNMPH